MENASKALIIAGAILLSILLISLGIMIFNNAQNVANGQQMDQAEVTSFNNQFAKYEGKRSGTVVRSLVQEINTNNSTDESGEKQIALVGVEALGEKTYKTSTLIATKTYTVTITNYEANGRISEITIQ